jgi:branched-chain amino acid transport system substrate-binding protein
MLSRRRFLASLPLLAATGCSRRSSDDPLWAGDVSPLSGADRTAGEHFQRGLLLALKEINEEEDRVAGRRLAVLHADTRSQVEQALHEAVRLVSLNKLNALIGGRDQVTVERLAQALQNYPVPLLTPGPHGSGSFENLFSIEVSSEFRGTCLARFAADRLKAHRAVAIVDNLSPVCAASASAFSGRWRSADTRKLETWDARAEESAKDLPERLRKVQAEVLLFAAGAADLVAVRASLPPTLSVLFGGEPVEWQRLEANPDTGKRIYGATAFATSSFDKDGEGFLKRYRDRHHEEADVNACQGYELISILASALRTAKGAGPVKVREVLGERNDLPALNGELRFSKGHAVRALYVVRSNDPKPVQEFKPEES